MRVTHSHPSSEGLIQGAHWDADHTISLEDGELVGEQGPVGDKGPDGDPGLPGADGQPGADGEAGATGDKGPVGDKGETGDKGPTGDPGPSGSAGEAFPVGSVFLSVVSTNPSSLLGYGTWEAFGAGRMLLGWNTGDTDEATGGAATHTHAAHSGVLAHSHGVTDPGHVHDEYRNGATTGGLDGWGAGDTSTNNPTLTGYDTGSKVTGLTVDSAGSGSEYTHDSPSHMPPYVIVRMWKRTA